MCGCSDFRGVALRGLDDAQMLVLAHRDPALSIPLCVSSDREEIETAWQMWSEIFALPQLPEEKNARTRDAAAHGTMQFGEGRPKFLVRRRGGGLLNDAGMYRGEREIIARD